MTNQKLATSKVSVCLLVNFIIKGINVVNSILTCKRKCSLGNWEILYTRKSKIQADLVLKYGKMYGLNDKLFWIDFLIKDLLRDKK